MGDNVVFQAARARRVAENLVPITDFQSEYSTFADYTPTNYHSQIRDGTGTREDKYAWLLLLEVKTPDGTDYKPYRQDRTTKKPRYHEQAPRMYRRLYTFANIMSDGNTCVLFENGLEDQRNYLKYLEKCRIGDQFVAIEPNPETKVIGTDMPLLSMDGSLIPSQLRNNFLLPEVAVPQQIEQLNSSKFFVVHNATLQFDVFNLKKSNCTQGNLCDLRNPTRGDCACWFQRTRNRSDAHYTIRADITVNYVVRNVTVPRTDQLPAVHGWTSQYFTEFVFDGKLPLNPLQRETDSQITRLLRRKLRELVDYVNASPDVPEENRGWTVIGWYRRGTKTDGATAANVDDKVATQMDDSTMHIVRIEPTRLTKEQLNAAGLLLPVSVLGENTDIQQIRQENRDARNNRVPP